MEWPDRRTALEQETRALRDGLITYLSVESWRLQLLVALIDFAECAWQDRKNTDEGDQAKGIRFLIDRLKEVGDAAAEKVKHA